MENDTPSDDYNNYSPAYFLRMNSSLKEDLNILQDKILDLDYQNKKTKKLLEKLDKERKKNIEQIILKKES